AEGKPTARELIPQIEAQSHGNRMGVFFVASLERAVFVVQILVLVCRAESDIGALGAKQGVGKPHTACFSLPCSPERSEVLTQFVVGMSVSQATPQAGCPDRKGVVDAADAEVLFTEHAGKQQLVTC